MIEKLETFINHNGFPIIRRCFNCKNWDTEDESSGYCKIKPLYFAPTLTQTVYPITKPFYLCTDHNFLNEEYLSANCKKVLMKDIIKPKKEVKKSNRNH